MDPSDRAREGGGAPKSLADAASEWSFVGGCSGCVLGYSDGQHIAIQL